MTHPLSAEEMKFDISTQSSGAQEQSTRDDGPFWSTSMGKDGSDFPVYVVGAFPTV